MKTRLSSKSTFIKMMQIVTMVVLVFTHINNCSAQDIKDNKHLLKQRTLLEKYAFCKCLVYGFPTDSLTSKDFSISVLVEQLDYPIKVYAKVDSAAKQFAKSIPESNYGDTKGKMGIMLNCIEFYSGKKLDSLIRLYDY